MLVRTNDRVSIYVDVVKTDKSDTEKLLGVKCDNRKLTFDDHISNICKKEGRKSSGFARVTLYMDIA